MDAEQEQFGLELLTQEMVTVDKVHVNVTQSLVITTEDRIRIWLRDVIDNTRSQLDWVAPAGICLSIFLTLVTAEFKIFILPASTWQAIFVLLGLGSLFWLLWSLAHRADRPDIENEIAKLKKQNTDLDFERDYRI